MSQKNDKLLVRLFQPLALFLVQKSRRPLF